MIARVRLDLQLRKEFDYLIPPELATEVGVGTRVKVPFGPRHSMGCVIDLVETSPHTNLRPITKVIGRQALVTPKILQLARWLAEYYCCSLELALKSVLPEAVRKEEAGWRERLFVRVLPVVGEIPQLTKRQQEVWSIIEEWRELPLRELLTLADTTAETVRRLEDRGLVAISPQISERDPYANEKILPTQSLALNPEQAVALERIKSAMAQQRAAGLEPAEATPASLPDLERAHTSTVNQPCRLQTGSTLEDLPSPFFNRLAPIQKYSGWLPHWRQSDKLYFVTFRLFDSVAQSQLKAWQDEKEIWEKHHPRPWDDDGWAEYHERFTERMERLLDAGHGSCWLQRSSLGALTESALRHFDGDRYRLGDFVVMPNHVHVLVQPAGDTTLSDILHSWKRFTARECNKALGREGQFWQEEYFDHLVRSEAQLEKFRAYIRENPIKARLAPGNYRLGTGKFVWEPDPAKRAADWQATQCAAGLQPAEVTPTSQGSLEQARASVVTQPCQLQTGSTLKGAIFQRAAGLQPAEVTPTSQGSLEQARASVVTQPCQLQTGSTLGTGSTLKGTFLLHGVTGSGKTEVYLQAIAHALSQGRGAIVLVPEISLTPQTVERFKARFSSGAVQTLVAVLHSHLSAGERHDEWHKIRQGRARIVIGARSAIFAPVDPLGLIIVDEEHEHSYKQEEAPRYHARDVAVMRGQMENTVVVLGSATPSMESFYNAKKGKYSLLEMPTRVDDKKMPVVRVVDMRQEARKEKGTPIFSPKLKEAITQRLERKEQTMLFLNRRGYSTSLQCPQCGYVAGCPNCSVSLTYHRPTQKICCHICSYETPAPSVCPEPKCRNAAIRYAGLGTQKVEDVLGKLFPHARVTRMDSDTLKRKEDYRRILTDFRTGKIDILLGTQMIAKGLHFPNVTLVGIIHADLSLHIPDFRAGERTFQLLTQVAGRAGRGDVEGEVIVQSFTPFHPAIQYARRHDFAGFYEQEIEFREQLKYPPLTRVALLTLKGRNEDKVKFSAEHLRKEIEAKVSGLKSKVAAPDAALDVRPKTLDLRPRALDLIIAGPAPAPLLRAETFYRHQIMLRTRQMSKLSQLLAKLMETLKLPDDISVGVDIDPVNLA